MTMELENGHLSGKDCGHVVQGDWADGQCFDDDEIYYICSQGQCATTGINTIQDCALQVHYEILEYNCNKSGVFSTKDCEADAQLGTCVCLRPNHSVDYEGEMGEAIYRLHSIPDDFVDPDSCGLYEQDEVKCTGAANSGSITVANLDQCLELANQAGVTQFSYNSDKGKCFGVTEDTIEACLATELDEGGKWSYFELWCNGGLDYDMVCDSERVAKKFGCDEETVNYVVGYGDQEMCALETFKAGLVYYSYNRKKDKCYIPVGSTDDGYTECITNMVEDTKQRVYAVSCGDLAYPSNDYFCGDGDSPVVTRQGYKCDAATTADSSTASLEDCNALALSSSSEWFAYNAKNSYCWIGADQEGMDTCKSYQQVIASAWDVYAACGN